MKGGGAAAAAFVALTGDVLAGGPLSRWERRLLRAPSPPHPVWRAVSALGEGPPVTVLTTTATALAGVRGTLVWRPAAVVLGGCAARSLVCRWLNCPRPPAQWWLAEPTGPSYPSRHTTWFALAAGAVVDAQPDRHRPVAQLLAAGLVAGVGASRVRLGVHWVTDVLGGLLFALAWRRLAARLPGTTDRPA